MVISTKFRSEHSQILGTAVRNVVARGKWHPGDFVHPWMYTA